MLSGTLRQAWTLERFLIVGESLSWNANGILKAAATTAIFNSAAVRHNISSED